MSGLGKSEIDILASLVSNSGLCMNWAAELGAGIYFTIFAIPTLKRIAQSSKRDMGVFFMRNYSTSDIS